MVLIRAHISGGISSLASAYIVIAKRSQGPKFLHQLRTSALPPNHLRASAEKVSRIVKPLDKPTTPACLLRSSTEKVSKVIKPLVKPTTLSSPLRLSPRKHSKTQPSTNKLTHPRRPAMQSSRTPSPPSSPHVMRSSPLSPSPPHMRRVLSTSNQHTSTPSAHEEIAESSQVAHPPTLEENIAQKKRRGETRGLGTAKKKCCSNPIEIDIPEHVKRAVGANCQSYITEIGCIVRQNAPLQVKHWSGISKDDVALMVRLVHEKFKLENEPHVNEAIEADMKRRYSTWRYNLHKTFLQYESVEEALENRPENVGEDDWNFLINWWHDDQWLELSGNNKKNRDKLTITHCAGTKAFSRIRYENQNPETGEELSRIDMFKLTRFRENKKTWVGDVAEHAYEATRRADEAERRSTQLAEELEAMKASAAQQNEELEAVKASAAQQNEQLEAVKAKQNETDALLKKLLEQFSSRK
ncbi:uncharacterized protein LOC112200468 isoform X3 [Rosa chinensis]|uniref:uncharacterized protein LOC112200468 isoform X3 n=1 Tax=Rosa chinensis TaxID=74649 RepID=UPI000D088A3C|nr:uncharacterized protein LOC112200468 isoform X3 [Rosa chinensis]